MPTPERRLRRTALGLCLLGIGVAGYLTWVHYHGLEAVCFGGSHGCERVQSSDYASLAGVPVALFGLLGYVGMLALLLAGRRALTAAAGLGIVMFGFSAYLTYLELFVIKAICQWCVTSAVLSTGLAITTTAMVLRTPPPTEA